MISNIPDGYIELNYDAMMKDDPKFGAVCFAIADEMVWIPRSQLNEYFEDGEGKTMIITEWIAKQKGLI